MTAGRRSLRAGGMFDGPAGRIVVQKDEVEATGVCQGRCRRQASCTTRLDKRQLARLGQCEIAGSTRVVDDALFTSQA